MSDGSPGRPSKYDPAYCEQVIADAAEGFSLTAFAGLIGVDRTTITEWRKVHPEFDGACERHKAVRARFLEGGMLKIGVTAPEANARRFALVNAAPEDWREKLAHVGGGPEDAPIRTEGKLDVSNLSIEQLRALASIKV